MHRRVVCIRGLLILPLQPWVQLGGQRSRFSPAGPAPAFGSNPFAAFAPPSGAAPNPFEAFAPGGLGGGQMPDIEGLAS